MPIVKMNREMIAGSSRRQAAGGPSHGPSPRAAAGGGARPVPVTADRRLALPASHGQFKFKSRPGRFKLPGRAALRLTFSGRPFVTVTVQVTVGGRWHCWVMVPAPGRAARVPVPSLKSII